MSQVLRGARRTFALVLALLVIAPSGVIPLLDRGELHERPVVQSDGANCACVPGHHHWVCTQHGANPLAVAAAQPAVEPAAVQATATLQPHVPIRGAGLLSYNLSRAPPPA